MHVDVVALLEDGLRSVGRESLLSPGLEAHSTIALDFADTASIMIDQIDGQVWLSAALDVTEQRWESAAVAVLACVSEQSEFIASRAPAVFKRSGAVDLYALVHPDYLTDSATFMRALEGFQDRVKRLVEALS
jgi:type III secretion system chaperone